MFGRKNIEILPEDRVKLPVVLGIKPGYYLAFLYGCIILAVLFVLLLYPGLSKPGIVAVISSEPSGAAIRVDGVTLGSSPCEVFLPKGKRTVEMVLPGFESYTVQVDSGGRIFASTFFPEKIPVRGTLVTADPVTAFAAEAADYVRWSFAGEPAEVNQIPLSLSEGAYRTGPAAVNPELKQEMDAVLKSALRFASTRAAVRDLLRAKFLAGASGLSPSPFTLVASIQEAAASIGPEEPVRAWLAGLGYGNAGRPGSTADGENAGQTAAIRTSGEPPPLSSLTLNGQEFIPVRGGVIEKNGADSPVPSMFIAGTEVSSASWDAFVAENPEWSADNREALIAEGLVSRDYLLPFEHSAYPWPAVPGVSWYAARAYCRWLSGKLPAALSGWEVTLPAESEWHYAALYFEGRAGTPENLLGGLWEWCREPYAPLDFFPPSSAVDELDSPERPVKGGSWINQPGTVNLTTRGSLPPGSSSPFVGFRPVIVSPANPAGTE
ncbi:MAG: SUMF1/EgtB/PvdO family nonheme iron enzyme [Treponema sp.]|jgi:hypothetical protein|nr:SUMF1/EgtB/PvdO family nonheme iron enzyme [Treponema sp.]